MSEELKPCPFCGGKAWVFDGDSVGCENTCINGDPTDGDLPTFETWNTRPVEDQLRAANKRLRTQLDTTDTALGRAQFLIANALEYAKNYDPAYAVEMIRKMLEDGE
jgi:hypothetical protein